MVYALIGESCTGKSTIAKKLKDLISAEVITGKDYLRMAKNENEATELFRKKLANAVDGDNIIYVISEKEHIALLPPGAVRVLVTAGLETIKERFRARMHGNLPKPVEQMLERKHGMFDDGDYNIRVNTDTESLDSICARILNTGAE
ncbi:hypothetical protein N1236_04070 [Acetivibrio thermocellus]|uniref:hypothetical protein n=1 Tax=Acetivibrio thermocellus TaxID=1515 RepID=UPI0021ADDD37|nr:hypothetical protein [Acetivibrio thermocellus]UWV47696.1 hypothetical protein N1236_04070 [Acetivibrio thermocellus]